MSNNNNKQTILNLFLDNIVGNITAETLRNFISTIFDDKEVIIKKFDSTEIFNAASEDEKSDIYENSLIIIKNDNENNGVYLSLKNQPQSITDFVRISNNFSYDNYTKTVYEYTAFEDQFYFECQYSDNLVDVYKNGLKIKNSDIVMNENGDNIVLKNKAENGDEIEIVCLVKT